MKKSLLFNIIGLVTAAALLSGSAAFAATQIETAPPVQPTYDDDFLQENEQGIADLLEDSALADKGNASSLPDTGSESTQEISSETSSQVSSTLLSSTAPSSAQTSSAASSNVVSSNAVVSSAPGSSEPPPSSLPPSSAEPSSAPPSSEEEPISSEESSSEEEVTSDEPSSEDEDYTTSGDYDDILETLAGTVQREIIGINTPPNAARYEAYKAQAVAAHSYMEYHRQRSGSYPQMSYTTPDPKTVSIVQEVLDKLIYYNGSVINAAYCAAAGGHTQSAESVWGNDVPYMLGVESAYDDYESVFTVSENACRDLLEAAGISVDGDPSEWFDLDGATRTDGEFVGTMDVCGMSITGRTLRETVFGTANLKSAKITDIYFDGSGFSFTTYGFGHGAGMSQLGAIGYAENEGWDYQQILEHYYSGVTIE